MLNPLNTSPLVVGGIKLQKALRWVNRNEIGACLRDTQGSSAAVLGDEHGKRKLMRTVYFPQALPFHLERVFLSHPLLPFLIYAYLRFCYLS